ncbi:MAG TPA: hypothetical protein VFD70_05690 [Anaerolineae bacterium]|nr:hypothetical protein [Anaerolineae bacterium]
MNTSPIPIKTDQSGGIGSSDGKLDTATIADTAQPNTLGNPSRTDGTADADGPKTESVHHAPSTSAPSTASGKRLASLSGLLKADNVDGILYLGDYESVRIEVTFQNGAKDSKVIAVGEQRDAALALLLLNDNPLAARNSFFEVSAK